MLFLLCCTLLSRTEKQGIWLEAVAELAPSPFTEGQFSGPKMGNALQGLGCYRNEAIFIDPDQIMESRILLKDTYFITDIWIHDYCILDCAIHILSSHCTAKEKSSLPTRHGQFSSLMQKPGERMALDSLLFTLAFSPI